MCPSTLIEAATISTRTGEATVSAKKSLLDLFPNCPLLFLSDKNVRKNWVLPPSLSSHLRPSPSWLRPSIPYGDASDDSTFRLSILHGAATSPTFPFRPSLNLLVNETVRPSPRQGILHQLLSVTYKNKSKTDFKRSGALLAVAAGVRQDELSGEGLQQASGARLESVSSFM